MDSFVYVDQDEDPSSRLYFLLKDIREKLGSSKRKHAAVPPGSGNGSSSISSVTLKLVSDQISTIQRLLLEISQVLPRNPISSELAEYADDIDVCMGCCMAVAESLEGCIRADHHHHHLTASVSASPASAASARQQSMIAMDEAVLKAYTACLKELTAAFQYILSVAKQRTVSKRKALIWKTENRRRIETIAQQASRLIQPQDSRGLSLHLASSNQDLQHDQIAGDSPVTIGSRVQQGNVKAMKFDLDVRSARQGVWAQQELLELGGYFKDLHIDTDQIAPAVTSADGERIGRDPWQMQMPAFNEDVFSADAGRRYVEEAATPQPGGLRRDRSSSLVSNEKGPTDVSPYRQQQQQQQHQEARAQSLRRTASRKWLGKIFRPQPSTPGAATRCGSLNKRSTGGSGDLVRG